MHVKTFNYVQSKPIIVYVKNKQQKHCNKWIFKQATRLKNILS